MALQGEGCSKHFPEHTVSVGSTAGGGCQPGGESETLEVGFLDLGRASGIFLSSPAPVRIPVLEGVGLFSRDHTEERADGLTGQVFLMISLSKHAACKRTFFHLTTTPFSYQLASL